MPPIIDKEQNDLTKVYIDETAGLEDYYPSFISLDSVENVINFRPEAWNRGQTYYFTIVLQEENSESIFTEYFCEVKVNGA